MKRRDFLAASCAAGLLPISRLAAGAEGEGKKDLHELRTYRVAGEDQRKRLDEMLAAATKAWQAAGAGPVGCFEDADGKSRDVHVLLTHRSMESVLTLADRLLADAAFRQAAGELLKAPKTDPVYDRIDSSLFLAFDAVPHLEPPDASAPRIFQLRIYESHSLLKARKKVEMFNEGGEVAIFRDCGMNPVFFGEALIGSRLPNLTYMLTFADDDARKAAWKKFLAAPAWKKLRRDPQYKDTVSKITNLMLNPTAYSQV